MLTEIVYEDKEVLVVRKPAGLATQTARVGQQDVVSELKNYLRHSAGSFSGKRLDGCGKSCSNRFDSCGNLGGGKSDGCENFGSSKSDGCGNLGSSKPGGYGKTGSSKLGDSGKTEPYLGVIHRLDQPVEGLLVFAKNRDAASCLTEQLQGQDEEGSVFSKRYYAVLCGIPGRKTGRLTDILSKESVMVGTHKEYRSVVNELIPEAAILGANVPSAGTESVRISSADTKLASVSRANRKSAGISSAETPSAPVHPGEELSTGQRAELEYEILQVREEENLCLADIRLVTGRFHQIRAQMAHAGTPLLGDMKYGSETSMALARKLGIRHVALCAYSLEFRHPVSGERMEFRNKPGNPAFSFFSQL